MLPVVEKISEIHRDSSTAFLFDEQSQASLPFLDDAPKEYLFQKLKSENEWVMYHSPRIDFYFKSANNMKGKSGVEKARKAGSHYYDLIKKEKVRLVQIKGAACYEITMAFLEGLLLSAYTFSKYKKEHNSYYPSKILIEDDRITEEQIQELIVVVESVFLGRNLVNEPLSYLTAERLSQEIEKMGQESGFKVEVFNRKKIESLRMGGILAVNRGSLDPPTFTILEWNPQGAINQKPLVLVGKGVVFDTGGLSLKPTPRSMDYMKSDMAGGAVVAATLYAVAKNNLPVHVIGLIPATDNRPDGNAYVPGDIITMHDGTTVEIRNTDAEGRLLLADALSYAGKYDPMLVIDIATLTGSAEVIAGSHAMVSMGNSPENLGRLRVAGEETYERMIEVPLWEEYAIALKSDVADMNNLGKKEAQTSTAGKFLEHFTSFPWIHLDIAGVAWLHEKDFYRPAGGTGFGIRALYHFLKLLN